MIHRCWTLFLFALLASLSGGCSWSMKMPPEPKRAATMTTEEARRTHDDPRWKDPVIRHLENQNAADSSVWTYRNHPSILAQRGDVSITHDFLLMRKGESFQRLEGVGGSLSTGRRACFSPDGTFIAGAFWRAPLGGFDLTPDVTSAHVRVWETSTGRLVVWLEGGSWKSYSGAPGVLFLGDNEIAMRVWNYSSARISIVDIHTKREVACKWWGDESVWAAPR